MNLDTEVERPAVTENDGMFGFGGLRPGRYVVRVEEVGFLPSLGQALLASGSGPTRGHLLITHTHWDHIQGLPFFGPLFVPGHEWDIYGPRGLSGSLREALAGQMQHTYFPVTLDGFAATVRYHDLVEGSLDISDVLGAGQ